MLTSSFSIFYKYFMVKKERKKSFLKDLIVKVEWHSISNYPYQKDTVDTLSLQNFPKWWYAIIHVLVPGRAPPLRDSLGCEVQWAHSSRSSPELHERSALQHMPAYLTQSDSINHMSTTASVHCQTCIYTGFTWNILQKRTQEARDASPRWASARAVSNTSARHVAVSR